MSVTPGTVHEVLQKWIVVHGLPLVYDIDKSHGCYLHDAKTGVDFLDFFSFVAARPLGYNHAKLKEAAFVEELTRAALHKPANCDVYTVEYARFAEAFGSIPLAGKFKHLFFIEGGGPAVDNAVKAAIDWKHHKNLAARRGERGSQIVHFKQGFHGRTGYALSLTDSHDARKTRFYPKFNWPRVTNPFIRFPFDEKSRADVEAREAQALSEINRAFEQHGDDIAAIIIEPIQGEGGDNYFRSEFLRALRRIADDREALLIFDEIQTGFGSTGRWWDFEHHEVTPDLLVFGKKTQVCGVAAGPRLDEVESVFHVASRISSTFEGNLVDMVRCTRIIDIMIQDDLLANAATMGRYLLKALTDLAQTQPAMTNVRGRGLWAAFDLPSTEDRDRVIKGCYDEQLLVMAGGARAIRMRAALDVDADAIGRAAAQLEAGLRRAYGRAR
ncbi:MAG: L-lysine 6-transaminase [Deltaproteobacteria bacterium]|nr:L-lysine 6-transaminase [Deltaproteobacteria bacterium]